MNIKVIYVSSIKNSDEEKVYLNYIKKISRFTNVELIRVNSYKSKDYKSTVQFETKAIKNIVKNSYCVLMDVEGVHLDSIEFSSKVIHQNITKKNIFFVVGGSWGVDKKILIPNLSISFGKITIAHRLFLCLLLEQIFRSYKIINGEEYHK